MALTNQLYHTSIKIGEDAQTQIDFETANEIHFDVDGTEALRLDSSQIATFASNLSIAASKTSPNVSIGGSSATTAVIELIAEGTSGTSFIDFHAEGAPADYALRVQRFTGANGSARIDNKGTGDIQFYTNGTEALRLDSSQNLAIGDVTPEDRLHVAGDLGNSTIRIEMTDNAANTNSVGDILWRGPNAAGADRSWAIIDVVASDATATDAYMAFSTIGGGTTTEALRIDSSQVATFASKVIARGNDSATIFEGQNTSAANRVDFEVKNASGGIDINAPTGYINLQQGGGDILTVRNDGIALQSTDYLYLDGGSNTYLVESAADVIDIVVGGGTTMAVGAAGAWMAGGHNFTIQSGDKLYLDGGSNTYFTEAAADTVDLYVGGSQEFRFESDGDFHADGDVYAFSTTTSSDIRLKKNVVQFENALDTVKALRGVEWDWIREEKGHSAGLIAQEVEEVMPYLVKTGGIAKGEPMKTLNYNGLIGVMIEAIKELAERVN